MESLTNGITELTMNEVNSIGGGYAIIDGIATFYHTMGSFYHGLYDGLMSN